MASDEVADRPGIALTESALKRLRGAIEAHPQSVVGIRIAIAGRGPDGFQHSLAIVEEGDDESFDDDEIVETEGLKFYLEGRNAEYLNGVEIDFQESSGGGVIQFRNPNPLWSNPVAQKVQTLFDEQINPQIAAHGGAVSLIGVEGEIAYVELGGGCVGCGMVDVTLKQGIEVAIKETVPEITEVVDTTDHDSGSNPYYKPSKK